MSEIYAQIDRDGDGQCGTTIRPNLTEATQVNFSVDGWVVAGVEFDVNGVGTIGWYPPDQPDTWVELATLPRNPWLRQVPTGTPVTDA